LFYIAVIVGAFLVYSGALRPVPLARIIQRRAKKEAAAEAAAADREAVLSAFLARREAERKAAEEAQKKREQELARRERLARYYEEMARQAEATAPRPTTEEAPPTAADPPPKAAADYSRASVDGLPDEGPAGDYKRAIKAHRGAELLPVFLGGRVADLKKMRHVLIAGATGSGKSCFLHSLICGIMATKTPQEVQFLMVDPKQVELAFYNGSPFLARPVASEWRDVQGVLMEAADIMHKRNAELAATGKREAPDDWPRIIVVIEEFTQLLNYNKAATLSLVAPLAELGRSAGVHLILSAQRPDRQTFSGRLRANIDSLFCFRVVSPIDARIVFGHGNTGAELLTEPGQAVYRLTAYGSQLQRLRAPFLSDEEIAQIAHSPTPI
jgi:energy-coupling factor transporter ATP-binding protein EcfA2